MKLTGHKTESIYRRYAITCAADLLEGLGKLATLHSDLLQRRVSTSSERHILGHSPSPSKVQCDFESRLSDSNSSRLDGRARV